MTICTHDSLAGGGVFLVMSNLQLEKFGFSRGVALPYVTAPDRCFYLNQAYLSMFIAGLKRGEDQ